MSVPSHRVSPILTLEGLESLLNAAHLEYLVDREGGWDAVKEWRDAVKEWRDVLSGWEEK
ncbi:hypothetical protein EV702DRAFT_1191885 [Suillus placidus]|uniref:Uncharacterized protein n=1 Tax=Suillus placidus TaxID=48579 RepID=A0A9P7D7V4_9AGAM|nr:hypothetical protein EV702DRAFT_1191885 [Suillus placidus]